MRLTPENDLSASQLEMGRVLPIIKSTRIIGNTSSSVEMRVSEMLDGISSGAFCIQNCCQSFNSENNDDGAGKSCSQNSSRSE